MPRLVLDANLLLVFVIGLVDPGLLGVAKRVKEYGPEDYGTLVRYIGLFRSVILLPNTVSEASNLLDHLKGNRRRDCMSRLADLVAGSTETYVPSGQAITQPEYGQLGITDSAILCTLTDDVALLTADLALYLAALGRGRNAQHFPQLRG